MSDIEPTGHTEQIFLLDLDEPPGQNKRQLTGLDGRESPDRCCELFLDKASGFNAFPGFYLTYHAQNQVWGVRKDGTEKSVSPLTVTIDPAAESGRRVAYQPEATPPPRQLMWVPVLPPTGNVLQRSAVEVFWVDGRAYGQVTNFNRLDTFAFGGFIFHDRGFFTASAPSNRNPDEACQLFSKGLPFGGTRQLTRFAQDGPPVGCGKRAPGGLFIEGDEPGCSMSKFEGDPVTGAIVFSSSCDVVHGLNPFGEQIFAMRPDGTGMRQLTRTQGRTIDPDGTIHVELPGPFAYTSRDTR
jgi:hypothetical protein